MRNGGDSDGVWHAGREYHTSAEEPRGTFGGYLAQRLLEIIPGCLVWGVLVLPVVLYLFAPWVAGYVFSLYLAYWAIRYVEMILRQISEYFRLRCYRRTDWVRRLRRLEDPHRGLLELSKKQRRGEEAAALRAATLAPPGVRPDEVYHLVILATYNEGVGIIEQSLDAIVAADYPNERLAVCLAVEERSRVWTEESLDALRRRYADEFGLFIATRHPDGLPGEERVKGANLTWAARHAREELQRRGIRDEQVVVSAFDADTRAGRDYFNVLAYKYLTNPNWDVDSYQPILMYHNNIWDVPTVSRLVGFCSTFWTMIESTRPERLRIFSSHAIGMRALVSVDYWSVVVIPDDSRQYWRMFFASDGRSRTVPLHTPVYMDAVLAGGYLGTMREQYLQLRRWAYGVIDFPYIMEQNRKNRTIPLGVKVLQTLRQLTQFTSWATVPFMLFMLPQLLWLLEPTFHSAKMAHWMAWTAGNMTQAMPAGIVVSIVISLLIIPPRPPYHSPWARARFAAEWLLLPVILIAFVCWPAIDAQTRLLLRRYMGFRVTVKNRLAQAHEIR